jgi:hypothetical protein
VAATSRLQELASSRAGGTRRRPTQSACARCRLTVRNAAVLVGAAMSGTAVLLNLLIDQSIQQHLVSALIFATVPAAAALAVGATLVALLWLLGTSYDLVRMFVLPGLVYCVCSGTPLLLNRAYHLAMRSWQILKGAGTRARRGLAWIGREIVLEALWINRGIRSVLGATAWIACWPIRGSALLMLRLIERARAVSSSPRPERHLQQQQARRARRPRP